MKGRDEVIRLLRAMSKPVGPDWLEASEVSKYIDGLWSESDRGVIILQAGTLELLLDAMLRRKMPHLNSDERSKLFDFNGPIGTFSNKIAMANALGIISRQTMRKFDLIREMRNACAHSREHVSFKSEPIYNAIVCLVHDMRIFIPSAEDEGEIKMSFLLFGILMIATVYTGSVNDGHAKVVEYMQMNPEKPVKLAQ